MIYDDICVFHMKIVLEPCDHFPLPALGDVERAFSVLEVSRSGHGKIGFDGFKVINRA